MVVDYLGNYAFIAVMKYLPALVIASALLLGPLVACAEGVLLGVEELPGAALVGLEDVWARSRRTL